MLTLKQRQCACCQEIFGCGSDSGEPFACWCDSVSGTLKSPDPAAGCYCPKCLPQMMAKESKPVVQDSVPELIEGRDYYLEDGKLVFTAAYHLRRGYCCESGCRHCPYDFSSEK